MPNENNGWDPESVNPRYHIRGNGLRQWTPLLTAVGLTEHAYATNGVKAVEPAGVEPVEADQTGEIIFKVEGANVITSLNIMARVTRSSREDLATIAVSTTNGLEWVEVWRADQTGEMPVELRLIEPVNGAYEVLVKVGLRGKAAASDARLLSIAFDAVTQLNSKTLPRLRLGKNTVCVAAGEQSESIVLWPDLSKPSYKTYVVEEKNVAAAGAAQLSGLVVCREGRPRSLRGLSPRCAQRHHQRDLRWTVLQSRRAGPDRPTAQL